MKTESRISQVKEIIDSYRYPKPFHLHLKNYFVNHKNIGSRDRKEVRMLCFDYFRCGRVFSFLEFEERLLLSHFLLANTIDAFTEHLSRNYTIVNQEDISLSMPGKIQLLESGFPPFSLKNNFPAIEEISPMIDHALFISSLQKQLPVWVKIYETHVETVLKNFQEKGIKFEQEDSLTYKVDADSKLTETDSFKNGYLRIQDIASQEIATYFDPLPGQKWWDCCAGSGGKSLALLDKEKNINLYASDIREEILENLASRFARHHVWNYDSFICDLTKESPQDLPLFDGIIVDAPCTGSGTWARSPENLVYFDAEVIADYQHRQMAILRNTYKKLKPVGKLFYITCSVYKKENEEVVEKFCLEHNMKTELLTYIRGYLKEAETMFISILTNLT